MSKLSIKKTAPKTKSCQLQYINIYHLYDKYWCNILINYFTEEVKHFFVKVSL